MPHYPLTAALIQTIRAACEGFAPVASADPALRRAAVGIVLVPSEDGSDEAAFLLTMRPPTMRAHGGQFALPGGKLDRGETAIEAAIRECEEELGLSLAPEHALGVLDDYPTRSGYAITPVVLYADRAHVIRPNPEEVAKVHRVGLHQITAETAVQFAMIEESDRPLVRLNVLGTQVHAPTAAMIYQFAELLRGRRTSVAHLDQPVFAWR